MEKELRRLVIMHFLRINEKKRQQELERISGLTSEQAKEYLLKTIEEDVKLDTAKMIKEMEKGTAYITVKSGKIRKKVKVVVK